MPHQERSPPSDEMHAYEHVVVRGLPFDRGFSHGSQVFDKVRRNVEYYRKPGKLADSVVLMNQIIKNVYIPALDRSYPSALEEMKGIAAGAQVTLEDVVLLNARYDLARLHGEDKNSGNQTPSEDMANECTSVYISPLATTDGTSICAQNWDMSSRLLEDDCIIYLEVHPDPSEHKPSLFLVTEAGQLGRSGMSSNGLSVTANSLMSTGDFIPDTRHPVRPVLPISLLRRMILESAHLAEAFTAAYNFPRHVSNNITVGTTEGFGVCLEVHPHRIYKVYGRPEDHFVAHANHFVHPGFLARSDVACRYVGGSSWFRHTRFESLIRPFAASGRLSKDNLKAALSDHLSYPESLCVHAERHPTDVSIRHLPGYPFRGVSTTVVCVIYDLTHRSISVCRGPPCQGKFRTFKLERPEGGKVSRVADITKSGLQLPERP